MRPSNWYAFLFLFLFLLIYSLAPVRVSAQRLSISATPDFDAVDCFVQAEMRAIGIPGLALAVMQLAEAGKLELDAPVQRYLPWLEVTNPSSTSSVITVRHLLQHTSGSG